jgi:hypothetical protein
VTPVEAYKLRMALVNAGYIPVPCLPDGKPIFVPPGIPSEPAVRSWATLHERATKTGILDPITKHVTLVTKVPTANQRRKEAERRARGVVPRSAWLEGHSAKPWADAGMSKSAWYRRNRGGKGVAR